MEPPVQISSRRDLLEQSAAVLASPVPIPLAGRGESAGASYGRPMVLAPLTLEADPASYDLGFRMSPSRRTPSYLARGCVANYPTKVAFVPEGRRLRLAHRVAGKLVSMDIPYIDLHEVLALDLTWKGTP